MNSEAGKFADLPFKGAVLTLLRAEPLKQVSMRLFVLPKQSGRWDEAAGKEFELHFTRVAAFKLNFALPQGAKLLSHLTLSESELLVTARSGSAEYAAKMDRDALTHFRLVCENGSSIDVIAQDCHCTLIWET